MMVRTPDYYVALEVQPNAAFEVIHAAYRVLALHHHPDRPTGSTERMIALNEAWAVLRYVDTRASYDRRRAADAELASVYDPGARPNPGGAFRPGPLARRHMARNSKSTILDFGQYAGWSVADIAERDPGYLDRLAATRVSRSIAEELHRVLATRRRAYPGPVPA